MLLVVSTIEELMVRLPAAPEVPDTMLSREPEESFSTPAVTPAPEELMAATRPASVLFEESRVMVFAVPLPTWMVMDPESVSEALVIGFREPLAVCARLLTTTVCVPAVADDEAAVSSSTFLFELEPVFSASTP